jgi:xanthine dehydrogenase iron-sulfur cluster and FAD-binding subunit A
MNDENHAPRCAYCDARTDTGYLTSIYVELLERAPKDREAGHEEADGILCELLRQLGFDAVVDAYAKIKKWYA